MNKKLQVFVSSTYTDLIEERQAAVQAILDAGHIPAGMELFKAGKSQMKTIHKWIDESDVYMLILGGRYGSIEKESGLSYTELEYNYALSKKMPVFAIVLEESFLFTKAASVNKNDIFEEDNIERYKLFKSFVVNENVVKFVSNIDKIGSAIHSHLYSILSDPEFNLIGWIRGNALETVNFEDLFKVFQKTILFELNNIPINANDYLLMNISQLIYGVSKTFCPNDYYYYSNFFLNNGLFEKAINEDRGEKIIRLSKVGTEYYNFLISKS